MKNGMFEEIRFSVKNWWLSLIAGILFVCVGIMMFAMPAAGYVALAIIFSVCVLLSGIFEISFAVSNRNLNGWGWYLAGGIIDLIIGILLVVMPGLSELMIPFLLAFWFMFRGISAIGVSIDMQRWGSKTWGWNLAFGILAVLCSIAILCWPVTGAITSVFIVAIAFFILGIYRIVLSFGLKKIKENYQE